MKEHLFITNDNTRETICWTALNFFLVRAIDELVLYDIILLLIVTALMFPIVNPELPSLKSGYVSM